MYMLSAFHLLNRTNHSRDSGSPRRRRRYMQLLLKAVRFLGVGVLLFAAIGVLAQSNATVQGQVTDQTGAAVAGANITVTNTATGVSITTKSDSVGNYQVPDLPVGSYDVRVEASGLERQLAKGLILQVGRN